MRPLTRRWGRDDAICDGRDYLVSLCTVWLRQNRQNFFNSRRSWVFDLFLVVT